MTEDIKSFGGDGAHEIRFSSDREDRSIWVTRDLWFDRNSGNHWIVWAQERAGSGGKSPAEQSSEAKTLGAIVVTQPEVMAFLEQLAVLLLDPSRFSHEPVFGPIPEEARHAEYD